MSRYSKVDRRIWADQRFQELTKPQPCAQSLWFYLLCSPKLTAIPGLITAGEAEIAEFLDWSLEGFREAFREVSSRGMVQADWKARMIWLPNATKYNTPESPNVVRSWRIPWDELPECQIKFEAWQRLKDFTEGLSEAYGKAFREACPKPSVKAMPNPKPEPEPEQKPKQEPLNLPQNQKLSDDVQMSSAPEKTIAKRRKPPLTVVINGEEKAEGTIAWEAYSGAYTERHGIVPDRNAATNSMIASLIKSHGFGKTVAICEYYPRHPDALYVRGRHPLSLLVRDSQRILADMQAIVPMTATRANGHDKTASNPFVKPYIEALERERQEREVHEQQTP